MVLPGNIQAWYEAPIYARVNGYLKNWFFDFGARVKKGDVLAVIDTPDLDAQLARRRQSSTRRSGGEGQGGGTGICENDL